MKTVHLILVAGLVLRFLCAAFLFHPDLKSQAFHAQFASRGIVDIYSFVNGHKSQLPYQDTFNYPPLAYGLLGSNYWLAHSLVGSVAPTWVNDWGLYAQDHSGALGFVLLFKLPYFICDLLLISLLLAYTSKSHRLTVAFLWSFNPFLLYGTYMVGQFDIVPTVVSFAAVLLFLRQKPVQAGLLLGIGIATKTFPLLVFPLLLLSPRPLKTKLQLTLSLSVALGVSLLPALLNPVYQSVQTSAGLLSRLLEPRLFNLPLIPIIIAGLYGIYFIRRRRANLVLYCGLVLLSAVCFIRFHAQWGVWAVPFLLPITATSRRTRLTYTFLSISFFLSIVLLPDQYVLVGLYSMLVPALSTIPNLASRLPHGDTLRMVARIVVSIAASAFIVSGHLPTRKTLLQIKPLQVIALAAGMGVVLVGVLWVSATLLLRYIPVLAYTQADRLLPITPSQPFSESFTISKPGLSQVTISLKNPRVANHSPFKFELLNSANSVIRSIDINGSNIPDGGDVQFRFSPIPDSAHQTYTYRLTTPSEVNNESQIQIAVSAGSLAQPVYQVFYSPQNIWSSLQMVGMNIFMQIHQPGWLVGATLFWFISWFWFRSKPARDI